MTSDPRLARHLQEVGEEAGPLLYDTEVAELLGISEEELEGRRRFGRILAVRIDDDWRYPERQIRNGRPLPRLPEVIEAHRGVDGWVILDSMLAKDEAFGGRCVFEILEQSDNDSLDRILRIIREQYAS